MSDCISVVPELPFKDQIIELAAHLSRSLPASTDSSAAQDFVAEFEAQVTPAEGEAELPEERKKEIVRGVVGKFVELRGGVEAAKEAEVESSHFLLQYVLSTIFDQASEEYCESVKSVNEAVRKGAEETNKASRVEAASRVLTNNYNFLPSTSPLRPSTLLTLISLLSATSDLSALPLSASTLTPALAAWSIPSSEKVAFLSAASGLYQSAGDLAKALGLLTLALRESVETQLVERAVLLALAVPTKFELDDVLSVPGAKEHLGKAQGVVELFEGDELAAVEKGKKWVAENAAWVEGAGIAGFTAESILRKLRLVALVALCSQSTTRQLSYAPIAAALSIPTEEVETWVIDAVRSKLLSARISQPTSLIRIQSISASALASRRFGPTEWQLLEKRLGEWKKSVGEARQVVEEAEVVAQQGFGQQQQGGRRGGRKDRREGGEGQQQQQGEAEAVAA